VRLLAGGNCLAVAPPFIITTEQIDTIVKVLDESIGIVEQQLGF
jgi:adenosylmethionine-8-amino-7-oxononanoate aminotransferase